MLNTISRPARSSSDTGAHASVSRPVLRYAGPLGLAAVLTLAACGGSDDDAEADAATAAGTADETATDAAAGTDETAAVAPTEADGAGGDGEPAIAGGALFADPQGTYEITIDPTWPSDHGSFTAETEVWFVGEDTPEFAPNINVITQAAPGQNLSDYLQVSLDQAPTLIEDFELVNEEITEGADGQELGLLEYAGDGLTYVAVFGLAEDQAVVATLTAPSESMSVLRDEILPYLLTLQPGAA